LSRRARSIALLAAALLAGCSPSAGGPGGSGAGLGGFFARLFGRRPPPPAPQVHYVVGDPYQVQGMWHYPSADFSLDETGLAAISPQRRDATDHRGLTADGELYDATAMAAGHPTLQLPAIVRVTDLENGRSVLLRVNDRGPAAPGRALDLTPRAAALLEAHDGTQIRIQVQEDASRQLAAATEGGNPKIDVAAAPPGDIKAETLAPPPGARAAPRLREAPAGPALPSAAPDSAIQPPPARLPEQVSQGPAQPGRLFIDAGSFTQASYARLMAGRLRGLGAEVTTDYNAPRDRAYQVRLGPFASVAEADAALDRAIAAGVTGGHIIVRP
jgi:rare lipoprotein A